MNVTCIPACLNEEALRGIGHAGRMTRLHIDQLRDHARSPASRSVTHVELWPAKGE